MKKFVAVIAVLALALTAFLAVGLAVQEAPRDPARRPRATPSPTDAAAGGGHRGAVPGARRPLLPAHRLAALRDR